MTGPGIRYLHLAQVLSREFPVTLAIPNGSSVAGSPPFEVFQYRLEEPNEISSHVRRARVVVAPALMVSWLLRTTASLPPLVVDGYAPWAIEALFLRQTDEIALQRAMTEAYLAGDFFICASDRQRDWWLGILSAMGRINSYTLGDDVSLRKLVDIVPFGLPVVPPESREPVIKGVWDGIAEDDKVILWGGGLWRWFDPLTAVRAMQLVNNQRTDVRLVFLGIGSTSLQGFPTLETETMHLAQELGLLDRTVFFGKWVPYGDWPEVLLESDVALSLHLDSLEARLAFRTRIIDYIWVGVPIVATRGDVTADLVERYNLGRVVNYGEEAAVAEAILELLNCPKETMSARFEQVRRGLTWEKAVEPLLDFCRAPEYAPDRRAGEVGNPFYRQQIERLQGIVNGYERGRFIRTMKWLKERVRFGRRETL